MYWYTWWPGLEIGGGPETPLFPGSPCMAAILEEDKGIVPLVTSCFKKFIVDVY